ncbi:hypothetical protein F4703DRAFT_1973931 [Phycomyces blakesleeanus]
MQAFMSQSLQEEVPSTLDPSSISYGSEIRLDTYSMWPPGAVADYDNEYLEALMPVNISSDLHTERGVFEENSIWPLQNDNYLTQDVPVNAMDTCATVYSLWRPDLAYPGDNKINEPTVNNVLYPRVMSQNSISPSVTVDPLAFNTTITGQQFGGETYEEIHSYDSDQVGYNTQDSDSQYDYTSAVGSFSPPAFHMDQPHTDSAQVSPVLSPLSNLGSSPIRSSTPQNLPSPIYADGSSISRTQARRRSTNNGSTRKQNTRRRTSANTSVASRVSLATNEPVDSIDFGVPYITFVYSANRVERHYKIRVDIDNIDITHLTPQYRKTNAVYPRALCSQQDYTGNRWNYETECNEQGWKLTVLNCEILSGSRGLIQRSVDCFRNSQPGMRSRRVSRQEKLTGGTLRRRKVKGSTRA